MTHLQTMDPNFQRDIHFFTEEGWQTHQLLLMEFQSCKKQVES